METKKNKDANIEKNKFALIQVGIAIAFTLTLVAFEWQDVNGISMNEENKVEKSEEIPPLSLNITELKKEEIIEQPKKPKHKIIQKIIIDNVVEKDSLEIADESKFKITDDSGKETKGRDGEDCPECDIIDDEKDEIIIDEPTFSSDIMPEFKGLYEFLAKNIKYPEIDKKSNSEGTVYVQFVIEKDGSVSSEKILRGVTPSLDREALRVVKLMPNWTPGETAGNNVRVKLSLPIKFKLAR